MDRVAAAANWMLAGRWRVPLAVLLLIAVPVLVLGEASAADTRERLHSDDLSQAAASAARAADVIAARELNIQDAVKSVAVSQALYDTVLSADPSRLNAIVAVTKSSLSADVERILIVDPVGTVLAQVPASEPPGSTDDARSLLPPSTSFVFSGSYVVTRAAQPPALAISAPIRPRLTAESTSRIVAAIPLSAISSWIAPLAGTSGDVYVVDERGRLIGRARGMQTGDFLRDLAADPAVRATLGGRDLSEERTDPLSGDRRAVATGAVAGVGWHVIAVGGSSALAGQVETALGQQRLIRLLLVLMLMLGSVVVADTAGRNLRLNETLRATSRELERASRAKSEFLANMSHELRTPLNAIIGFSDVLGQQMFGELNAKQEEYLADIGSSGKHLLDLVNQILDLSKVEAGRMDLEPSTFAPGETIRASLAFVRAQAEAHHIELVAEIPADLPVATADERKIRQVLLNLLSNAVKFTPDGGRVAVRARTADGNLEISVADSGIGIPAEDHSAVFEEFRQVGGPSERSHEGTGLGLALAKRFIELHGGRIWVESVVGEGSTFSFAIPIVRQTDASSA